MSKVDIRYGNGILQVVEEQESLQKITSLLKDMVVTEARSQELPSGYLYYLDIYDGDKKVRFSATLILNRAKYVSPSSQKAELDRYMDSLYQQKTGSKLLPEK